jgi:hypothetical protein
MKRIFTLLSMTLIVVNFTFGQITWNFTGPSAAPSSGIPANMTVSNVTQGNNNGITTMLSTTSASTYTGASGTVNASAAAFATALSTSTSTYFEVTFTPDPGYQVNISNIQLGNRSTATGPQLLSIRSSVDAYATDAGTVAAANNSTWVLLSPATFSTITGAPGTAVTIRIYGSNGTGTPAVNTANWRIDDLVFTLLSILPVKLQSFTAALANNAVAINWKVATESNINNYSIERSSNGVSFNAIGTVNAQNLGNYNFIDNNALQGTSYYRLKVMESNGTFNYSPIAKVKSNGKNLNINAIYPSPVKEMLTVNINNNKVAFATINIVDLNGKTILTSKANLVNGLTQETINVANLKAGVYMLRIDSNGEIAIEKFVKQ